MAKIIEVKPHGDDSVYEHKNMWNTVKVFLAGTMDMGHSEDWQKKFTKDLGSWLDNNLTIIVANPRRDKGFKDDPQEFDYQVNWELDHLENADIIIMYIAGNSKSPVSLMELGLFARNGNLYVICEPEFYRYGNVEKVCERYGVPLFHTIEEFKNYTYGYQDQERLPL